MLLIGRGVVWCCLFVVWHWLLLIVVCVDGCCFVVCVFVLCCLRLFCYCGGLLLLSLLLLLLCGIGGLLIVVWSLLLAVVGCWMSLVVVGSGCC